MRSASSHHTHTTHGISKMRGCAHTARMRLQARRTWQHCVNRSLSRPCLHPHADMRPHALHMHRKVSSGCIIIHAHRQTRRQTPMHVSLKGLASAEKAGDECDKGGEERHTWNGAKPTFYTNQTRGHAHPRHCTLTIVGTAVRLRCKASAQVIYSTC